MYHDKHQAPPADDERRAPRLLAAFQTLWVAGEWQIFNRRATVTKLLDDITGFILLLPEQSEAFWFQMKRGVDETQQTRC